MSTVSGVELVSPARERELHANILEQLVHSVLCKYCVPHEIKGSTRTPFIFIRDFIAVSGLLVKVSDYSSADYRGPLP